MPISLSSLSVRWFSKNKSALACRDLIMCLFTPEIAENIDFNMFVYLYTFKTTHCSLYAHSYTDM